MAEQPKVDHPYSYPYNLPPPPPGPPGSYPPFLSFPPPPDGQHPEGAPNGVPPAPYMTFSPGTVVYFPPPHPQGQPNSTPSALSRPKRKQVKMACTNCAGACKRCDDNRPCERCVKYGISDTCVDGQRKERKKGIKRGPYRRKSKGESEGRDYSGPPPPSTSAASPPIHPFPPFPPEGFLPFFYPPHPGTFLQHPPEGQPGPDGAPPGHPNGHPMFPYYFHAGYPPVHPYPVMYPPQGGPAIPGGNQSPPQPSAPAPATPASPSGDQTPQSVNATDTASKASDHTPSTPPPEQPAGTEGAIQGKKRSRGVKSGGEPKVKKAKASTAPRAEKEMEGSTPSAASTAEPGNATGDNQSDTT